MSSFDRFLRWIADKPLEFIGLVIGVLALFVTPTEAPLGRWGIALILFVVSGVVWIARRHCWTRRPAYYTIVLTWDEGYKDLVLDQARRFFAQLRIRKARTHPLIRAEPIDRDEWRDLLVQAVNRLNEVRRGAREIHLISQAYCLWNLALGSQIQEHYPVILYHAQEGAYHRIWRVSREIRRRISRPSFAYAFCNTPVLFREGNRTDAVVLTFAVGPRDPSPAVTSYVGEHLAGIPGWIVRREKDLEPADVGQWIGVASELAFAVESISEAGSREIFLFGILPSTLALMVGTALGPYRKIHLMQYVDGTYREMLRLPLGEA